MFWRGERWVALLDGRFCVLRTPPVADKCLAQFVLLSLELGIRAAWHAKCFSNVVHGTVEGELACELSRSERNDSIAHLGKHGLPFSFRSLAFGFVVKTAFVFDAEFFALISNERIDFECSGFGAMPKALRDLERFVEFDTSDAKTALAHRQRKSNRRCAFHGRG